MSVRDVLLAAGGASALIVCLLIWARAPVGTRQASLLRLAHGWARLPSATASIVVLGVGITSALLLSGAAEKFAGAANAGAVSANGSRPDEVDQSIEDLRAYAERLPSTVPHNQTPMPAARENLPDVETMISRLATRLENDRTDKDGWRTLGWAYLNTQRYGDAVKAYEVALELDPSNAEVKSSLEEARSKISGPAAAAAP